MYSIEEIEDVVNKPAFQHIKWTAVDKDNHIYGYRTKPSKVGNYWVGDYALIFVHGEYDGEFSWDQTLNPVNQGEDDVNSD